MFRGKKVLVTGGSGFVGTNLILRLLELGADVYATIHKHPAQIADERVHWLQADLQKADDCHRVTEGMQYVFMCAANTSGAAVMDATPLVHVTPNVIMNTNMLDAAYHAAVEKFLFISSSTIYPAYRHPVKEDEAFQEDPYEKYFCVGWMKRFIELECRMYSEKIRNPMKTVVVRPGNLYGEYDDFEWETSHVLPALIRRVVERQTPIEVWGDGSSEKDFLYIKDFVDALILAMEKIDDYDPINIAAGKSISIKDALEIIVEEDDYKNAEIKYLPDKPSMIPVRLIDGAKAKSILDFEAKTSFREGIRNTIRWYRKKHDDR